MAGFNPHDTLVECSESSDDETSEYDDFPLKRFTINLRRAIGQGSFGTVYKGRDNRTQKLVAVKKIWAKKRKDISCVMTEIKNIQRIKPHPYIVEFLDFTYFQDSFLMIMEFCELGDLSDYFKKYNPDFLPKLQFALMCASAIAHMHAQDDPIIHRDIKPANIMVTSKASSPVVKIADFGLSKIGDMGRSTPHTVLMETQVGTPGFMAPEIFAREKYTKSVDVFALGLVILSMIKYDVTKALLIPYIEESGKPCAIGEAMLMAHRLGKQIPEIVNISPTEKREVKAMKELIRKMTSFRASERPTADRVVQDLENLMLTCGREASKLVQSIREDLMTEDRRQETEMEKLREQYDDLRKRKTMEIEKLKTQVEEMKKNHSMEKGKMKAQFQDLIKINATKIEKMKTQAEDIMTTKAKENEQLRARIQDINNKHFVEIDKLETKNHNLSMTNMTQAAEIKKLKEHNIDYKRTKSAEIEKLKAQHQDLMQTKDAEIEIMKKNIHSLTAIKETEIEKLKEKLADLNRKNETERGTLRAKFETEMDKLRAIESDREKLRAKFETELQSEVQKLSAYYDNKCKIKEAETENVRAELDDLKKKSVEVEKLKAQLKARLS